MSNLGDYPLPIGWSWATIPMLTGLDGVFVDGDWVESKDQDPEGEVRLVQLADIGDGHFRDRSERFLTRDKAHALRCTFLKPEDVLIARMPDPLGRACVFPGDVRPCVTVVDVCIVRSGRNEFSHRWLSAFINASPFRVAIAGLQSGSTRKRISRGNLSTIPVPVPPLSEQRRLVAKLEELFSELDAGVAALRRAQRRLARYRQALLQAAVTGELTRAWREQQTHDIKLGKLDPFQLPVGWRMVTFREVIQSLRNGISVKPTAQSGTAILRISSVRPMKVDLSDVRYLEQPAANFEGFDVRPHDLLFTRYNGTPDFVGVCAMVPNFNGPLFYPDKLIRARMGTGEVLPAWVQVAFSAGSTRGFISDRIRTTAGQAGISGSDLKQAPLPVPPIAEQRAILAELDRRLSAADVLDATFQTSLRRAERLRQSILERAFRGELVPQDPNDEPTEALLARLKATAPDTPAPRRRGRPPKAEPAEPQAPRRLGRPRKQVSA